MTRLQTPLPGFPTERELRGLDHAPPGPARLLAELAVRGLRDEHMPAAAAIVRALEREAPTTSHTSQPARIGRHENGG